ncbi:MAG: hypothetical protein B7Y56_07005 [Gallionellales bacterium 35-53-114]|jgi:hypothetical protein|nr:MAG: hypothetical protein B7Y56_07005 [Gallionellales bacterium 35-53-114]OYZ63931.1 MAG: hypothetical protein B7Y04_08100 [Gallionellales bacterium 24-53-125]OZB09240.1 MAG: hypothetical protein B7X61_06110 [Gallionellales bacterium 39-52-133]HQS59160.1 DUF3014 domain-containing protein [Gallionellaceae bacterium]HQS75896.1 DUF3014 domain-containing protein [Gallionellaceae bacterium]
MNKNQLKATVALVILGGGLAAYFYWQQIEPEVAVQAPPPPPIAAAPKPEVRQIIETPPATAPLPQLADSDSFVLDALAGLVGNESLMKLFHTERIIRNIVATIDSLPTMKLPMKLLPVKQASGKFMTTGNDDELSISPKNAARYTPYVKIAEAMDAKKLVGLYVRLYPLFQQAYVELGYPNNYFNDRLIEVLDDLLEAPDFKEPVKLIRPNVMYQFADPELEALSIGQRMLMRIGSKNEATMKARLREIKQELLLHMQNEKIAG